MKSEELIRLKSYFLKNSRVKDFSGYGGKIHTLGWNSSGSRLASGSSDKLVNIYSLESTRLVSSDFSLSVVFRQKYIVSEDIMKA